MWKTLVKQITRDQCDKMLLRQPSRRLLQGTLLLLLGVTAVTVFIHIYSYVIEFRFYSRHLQWVEEGKLKRHSNQSLNCHIPDYNPFDPSLMPFVERYLLKCPNTPYLTFLDENGYIHFNKSGFEAIHLQVNSVNCEFYSINGVEGQKDKLVYGSKRTVTSTPLKVDGEFVHVMCKEKKNEKVIYDTCHSYVPAPNETLRKRNVKVQAEGRSNVLLLAIDSMSRLSFIRNLPMSYEFLTSQLHSVVMKGLNKVGRNTHPNMIPFLTGHKMYFRDDDTTPAFCKNTLCDGFFDDQPIAWKNFSQEGYVTMWLDEWLRFQLFYYDAKGFKHKPTDYYPRPLFQELELIGTTNRGFCFGNTPTYDFALDYTEKFVNAMKDTVYFAFPFIARISHDDTNTVQAMDYKLHKFLEKLYINGNLDNTVLLIFGDHGSRFGEIRKTLIGTVEDRMPFMSIYLPPKLREQKPHLQSGLETNSARLLSWFDMYELLMDLVTNNLEEVSRVPRWGFNVGLSPFRPFPKNRTCREAGIPPEYCVCMTPIDIDVRDDGVQESAEQVVRYVNDKLKSIPDQPCAQLVLSKIESAQLISHPQDVSTPNGLIEILRVSVWTLPSNALLQATFERRASNQVGKILGEVERLNKYGNQSSCIDSYADSRVHPYCFCSPTR